MTRHDSTLSKVDRSRLGAHYTTAEWARVIIARGLKPLIDLPIATSQQILDLWVVDPACGDGEFLVAARDLLAAPLVDAYEREGSHCSLDEAVLMVVRSCLVGVDVDPGAIAASRLRLGGDCRLECRDVLFGWQFETKGCRTAFVGNPPYLGGGKVSGTFGKVHQQALLQNYPSSNGGADLAVYFFLLAFETLKAGGSAGTVSFITTNTIAQGNTREAGLRHLLEQGAIIYHADRDIKWPGDAKVTVSVVHLANIQLANRLHPVPTINSRLLRKPERRDPVALAANADKSFQGSIVLGMGFMLTPDERDMLVQKDCRNAECIFPYLGGETVNTSPSQTHARYVISFGQMGLVDAERWPDLIEIVHRKVRPERDNQRDETGRRYWWRHLRPRPELYSAIAPLARCLVIARDPKHFCFSFQPTNRVFNEKLYVLPFETISPFGVLQSRVHLCWAYAHGRTLGGAGTPSYSSQRCFDTFPFPKPHPCAKIPALEHIGERLYESRARFMLDTAQGLTTTCNLLKDPACRDPRVVELRELHEALDRAVLDAYGWTNIAVPPYEAPITPEQRRALSQVENKVIDKLFELNRQRAEEENGPSLERLMDL